MPETAELTIDQKIAADLSNQYAENLGLKVEEKTPEKVAEKVEAKTEEKIAEKVEEKTPEKVEEKIAEKTEEKVEDKPVKTFEDYLAERSGGKYKKWEDVEVELTPKEVFANEKIKHLNELAAKGIDVTSREFLEIQSIDFEKMDNTDDILFEKWKRSDEGKGLSEKTIRYEINKKYNVNEWIEKEDSELTEDDRANQEKMLRDARESKKWLTNYKNERVLEKQVDPEVAKALAKSNEEKLKNWDKFVDSDLVNKITKLSSPVSYKDETGKSVESQLDFEITDEDRKEVAAIMKQLPRDSNVFFNQFKDKDGNRNHEALALMMLKARNFDKARALSYTAGSEQRALVIEKAAKNTGFKATESQTQGKVFATMEEAQKDAFQKMKI